MNSRREALAVTVGGASPADDARTPSDIGPVSYQPAPQKFRQVLGHFCTGVTVVTAMDDGEPVGFACQAFAALSLDPPLVVLCPALTSNTWPRIAKGKMFAINVLTEDQHDVAMRFGRSGRRKFDGVKWKIGRAHV